MSAGRRVRRAKRPAIAATVSAVALLAAGTAIASHPEVSLPGSNFEIDTDANLVVNDPAPSIDWASVNETRKQDTTSGATDESFGQGTKEDTAVPTVVNGSIPPNKSDLKFFGVYQEGTGGSGFLNLFWSRVQDPQGTTNMDFEFNKRQCTPGPPADPDCSANGLTPIRSAGDLLIQYDLANGGTNPELFVSEWVTSGAGSQCEASNSTPCWGARISLSDSGDAAGSINTSPISAANSDGLGAQSARTFGEAQIDLSAIFDPNVCESFGSAYLKSRSSDSFTAALKDFVPPAAINIANCGGLTVRKYIDINENGTADDAAGTAADLAGWDMTVSKDGGGFSCSGTTDSTGTLAGCTGLGTLAAGTYTVTELANASKTIGTNSSAFFNTDPGADGIDGASQTPALAAAPPVNEKVTIAVSGSSTVDFGNSCYATARFEVTGVPSTVTDLFARYSVNGGATADVNLTGAGTTKSATVGGLRRGDAITWEIRSASLSGSQSAPGFSLSGYPSCGGSQSVAFQTATVAGLKYKDLNADGTRDLEDGGLGGFSFTLSNGATADSISDGTFSFSGVAPGTYTIHEQGPPTGWLQTEPANGGDVTVIVPLGGGTVNANPFGDTPLSKIDVSFTSLAKNPPGSTTNATHPTSITCTAGGADVVTSSTATSATANELLLTESPVTCVITFVDP
jgi:hypothetical protein